MTGSNSRALGLILAAIFSFTAAAVAQTRGDAALFPAEPATFPAWAYPWDPDFKIPPADDVLHRLSGSTAAFSWNQARDLFFSPDWRPEDHPLMP